MVIPCFASLNKVNPRNTHILGGSTFNGPPGRYRRIQLVGKARLYWNYNGHTEEEMFQRGDRTKKIQILGQTAQVRARWSLERLGLEAIVADASKVADPSLVGAAIFSSEADFDSSFAMTVLKNKRNVLVFSDTPTYSNSSELDRISNMVVSARLNRTEWYIVPNQTEGNYFDRIEKEIALTGAAFAFEIQNEFTSDCPESRVLATVSVGFKHHPIIVAKKVAGAHLIRIGFSLEDAANSEQIIHLVARLANYSSKAPTTRSLGVGVVGYGPFGGMGHFHGKAVTATPGLEFVAAVDPDPHRTKVAESEFPGIRTYHDFSELANDPDVDIAIVATPPSSHFEIARSLLVASKHVVVEKPMSLRTKEADTLIEIAESEGLMLSVNQNRRWDQDFRAIKAAIDRGRLGEVFNIETFVGGFEHPCRAWHSEESISGGAAYDWGSHHIDWIFQLLGGKPKYVSAIGHKRVWHDITNLDQIRVRMVYPDGKEAEFFQSDVAGFRRPKFFIQGTKGTLIGEYRPLRFESVSAPMGYSAEDYHHAEAPSELKLASYLPGGGLEVADLPLPEPDKFGFHRNIADHLLLGEALEVQPKAVRRVVEVLEAVQYSSKNGGVSVELKED